MARQIICIIVMLLVFTANIVYYVFEFKRLPAYFIKLKEDSSKYEGVESWKHGGRKIFYPHIRMLGLTIIFMFAVIGLFVLSGCRDYDLIYLNIPLISWAVVTIIVFVGFGITFKVIFKRSAMSKTMPTDENNFRFNGWLRRHNMREISNAEFVLSYGTGMFFGITCGLVAYSITIIVML